MFLIIPEIKLVDGTCLECIDGQGRDDYYYDKLSGSPADLVRLFRRENAKSLLISTDKNPDVSTLESFNKILGCTDIPLQLSVPDIDETTLSSLLEQGLNRFVFPIELSGPDDINKFNFFSEKFGSHRIVPLIDIDELETFLNSIKNAPIRISIGKKRGEDWTNNELLQIVSNTKNMRVTLKSGIGNFQSLKRAASFFEEGIDSSYIGRPLFDNSFPCQTIWRNIEKDVDSLEKETEISSVTSH